MPCPLSLLECIVIGLFIAHFETEIYVTAAARILTPPISQVISSEATPNTINFTCRVEGAPSPVVVWTLNGQDIPSDGRHSVSSESSSVGDSHLQITASTLTISNLRDLDTAMVGCHSHIPASDETGGLQLTGDSVEVPFTVLGKIMSTENLIS